MSVSSHHDKVRLDLAGHAHDLFLRVLVVYYGQFRVKALLRERADNAAEVFFAFGYFSRGR